MSRVCLHGHVKVYRNGVLVEEGPNRITDVGLAFFAQLVYGTATQGRVAAISISTNGVATTATQTSMFSEKGRARTSKSISDNSITFTATFLNESGSINSMGLHNATATGGGKMIARWLTAAVPLTTGDRMPVTWTVVFGTG